MREKKNKYDYSRIVISWIIFINVLTQYNTHLLATEPLKFEGKIVFTVNKVKENYNQIFMIDGESKSVIQLTKQGRNLWPKWSSDGGKIVFASGGRKEHKNREIYIMNADGKNQKRLTYTKDGNSSDPRWGSEGETVYYRSAIRGNLQENVINLRNGKLQTIFETGGVGEIPTEPLHIEKLIEEFSKKEKEEQEKLLKQQEEKLKELQKWQEKGKGLFKIFPSPDGRYHLLYYDRDKRMVLLNIMDGSKKELKTKPFKAGSPSWSKDSKRMAYSHGSLPEQAMVIYDTEKDSYDEIKINMEADIACGGPSWSKESKHIVYSCGIPLSEEPNSWLYILDLETRKSTKLTQGSGPDWY